jgi:transcription elongation factor GreB
MNKAFTREAEGDDEDVEIAPLPAGGKNYMTREGYERLRAELLGLIDDERPKIVEIVHWAASNGDRSENGDYHYGKKRLREIDRRIRFLTQRLEVAEISDPSIHHDDAGVERTITILGIDEASSSTQQVSWISPVARALLKARIGDEVSLTTPSGVHTLEVLDVQYPAPSSPKL